MKMSTLLTKHIVVGFEKNLFSGYDREWSDGEIFVQKKNQKKINSI